MPKKDDFLASQEVQAVLRKRAKMLGVQILKQQTETYENLIVFQLGGEEKFALTYNSIDRIIPCQKITKIPGAPSTVAGLIYHDGDAISVIDLRGLLNIPNGDPSSDAAFILLNKQNIRIALHTDKIVAKVDFNKKDNPLAIFDHSNLKHKDLFHGVYQADITVLNEDVFFKESFFKE